MIVERLVLPYGPSSPFTAILAQSLAHPRSIAIRAGSETLDYATLLESAGRLAAALQALGTRRDDVIALDAERDPVTVAMILATLQSGAAFLALDATSSPARLAIMLEEARPSLVVGLEGRRERIPDDFLWSSRERLEATSASPAVSEEGELAYVVFTSGSTGRPKGVAMLSGPIARLIAWHVAHPRLGRAAHTLQFAPLHFDVSVQEILSTLATGGVLVLPTEAERRDPYALLGLIARERIERVFLPYVALQALAEAVAAGGGSPATLRDVVTAGEQLRITPAIRALFAGLPGCRLHNHYGPAETHVVTAHELTGDPAAWPDLPPIGRPLPHVRVRLVDAELNSVAAGIEGELLFGGGCLAAGYIHRPELTNERFIELDGERWYRTGDVAIELAGGAFDYRGRLDDQIKLDGYRIEPAEVEIALCRHPAVAEAAVVVVNNALYKRLVAHVVPRNSRIDDGALEAQLRSHCEAHLAAYLVPQAFLMHAILPLTPSGKIDRRMLSARAQEAQLIWSDDLPLEQQLTALWKQLLDLAVLDVNANLFDLGARSLTVVRALTELRRRGFSALTAGQIYEHPTVSKQAALIAAPPDPATTGVAAEARGQHQRAALLRFNPRPRARS